MRSTEQRKRRSVEPAGNVVDHPSLSRPKLPVQMKKADRNARLVAEDLRDHARVAKVHGLAHLEEASPAQGQ